MVAGFETAFANAGLNRDDYAVAAAIERFYNAGGTRDRLLSIEAQVSARMAKRGQQIFGAHATSADLRQPISEPGGHGALETHHNNTSSAREPIAGGEGHGTSETPNAGVPAVQQPIPESEGHDSVDAHRVHASSAQEPIPGETVQVRPEIHETGGRLVREPEPDRRDHTRRETQASPVPVGRAVSDGSVTVRRGVGFDRHARSLIHNQAPSPERMNAARVMGHSSVPTVFDRKLPDGVTRYGDIRTSQCVELAGVYLRHSSLLLRANDRALKTGKLGPRYTIRDLWTAKEFEKEIVLSGIIELQGPLKRGILIRPDGNLSFVKEAAP